MPQFTTERRIAHSAAAMFALVADVERYPAFVPLCQSLVVRRRRDEGEREVVVADMTVAFKVVRETFTTRVVLDRSNHVIDIAYLDGPFEHLDGRWSFAPDGEGACVVHFEIDYKFRSRVLAAVMGAAFETMFRKFIVAFEKRADAIYGRVAAS